MKKLPIYFLIILASSSCVASSKTVKSHKSDLEKYELAKEMLSQSAYNEAIKLFLDIYRGSPDKNNLINNSKYLSAYCYYKLQNYKDANFTLYQLISFHPEWENISAAYYLKGICQLESRNFIDAFIQFSKITKEPFLSKSNEAKGYFLQTQIKNDTLILLKNRFPNDKFLSEYSQNSFYKSEILTQSGTNFNIACLLPFEASAKSRFVYEFYEGMKLGADSLQKVGITLNLIPYESGKDSSKLKEFVKMPNVQNFDLVVGPVFSNQQSSILDLCKIKKMSVLNPFTQSSIYSNSFSGYFLNLPSYETQGKASANFAFKNFTRKPTSIIIYGLDGGDSITAKSYKQEFEKNGGKVLLFRRLSKFTANLLPTIMSKIKIDGIGHLAIFTSEPTLSATIFTFLETKLLDKTATYKTEDVEEKKSERAISISDIPVIVTSKWLDVQAISYEQFMLHNTHFVFQEYADELNIQNQNVSNQFFDKVGLHATENMYKGFASMLYWGGILAKYGNKFPTYIHEIGKTKIFDNNFRDYSNKNDNQFVPILKFEDYSLKLVNE